MRKNWKTQVFIGFIGLLVAAGAGAESLYHLPLCKLAEEREPGSQRTSLLEQCDKAERLITDWLDQAAGQGMDSKEAYEFAVYYIVPGHWTKLLTILDGDLGICGDGVCSGEETEGSCPADCGSSNGSDPGGNPGGDPGGPPGGGSGNNGGGAPGGQ